jgi:hypothetical protein
LLNELTQGNIETAARRLAVVAMNEPDWQPAGEAARQQQIPVFSAT